MQVKPQERKELCGGREGQTAYYVERKNLRCGARKATLLSAHLCVFFCFFSGGDTQKKLHRDTQKKLRHPKKATPQHPKTMASDREDGDGDVGGNDDGVKGDVRGSDHARGGRGQRVRRRLDDSDELEYGYRRSRRRTSYENRGSSSLTPAQRWRSTCLWMKSYSLLPLLTWGMFTTLRI